MKFDVNDLKWTRQPETCAISQERIEIVTKPHTDLWQRTYYHFRNDNAPLLQMRTNEPFFSFVVKRISRRATIALISVVSFCIWTAKTGSRVPSNMKTRSFSILEV